MTYFWLVNWEFMRIKSQGLSVVWMPWNSNFEWTLFFQVLRSADSYRYQLLLIWFWTWAKFWQHEILLKYSYFAQCWVKCSYSKLIFFLDFTTYERYVNVCFKKTGQTIVLYHCCDLSRFFLKQTLLKSKISFWPQIQNILTIDRVFFHFYLNNKLPILWHLFSF